MPEIAKQIDPFTWIFFGDTVYTDFTITLPLLIYGQPEDTGWSLRAAQAGSAGVSCHGAPVIIQMVRDGLLADIRGMFQAPLDLIGGFRIPKEQLLGVKILPDGALKSFFTPNAWSAYATQNALLVAAGS